MRFLKVVPQTILQVLCECRSHSDRLGTSTDTRAIIRSADFSSSRTVDCLGKPTIYLIKLTFLPLKFSLWRAFFRAIAI